MATHIQATKLFSSSSSLCGRAGRRERSVNNAIRVRMSLLPKKVPLTSTYDLDMTEIFKNVAHVRADSTSTSTSTSNSNSVVIAELHAIMVAISDRVEMHRNIGLQRDNWNNLLLTSINSITLAAAAMAGIASARPHPAPALQLSSTILYMSATAMLVAVNKIQPSQLAEEQRNAARLFKQLHTEIQSKLHILSASLTVSDVKEAQKKVLALDRAYPLPLLGTMLEKFPATVEPATWWPERQQSYGSGHGLGQGNGWSGMLEEEMRGIVRVLKRKDEAEYLRLSKIALKVNKFLAICGPVMTGLGAVGSAVMGASGPVGSWGMVAGVVGGAVASVVNALEHGGQVGMVFEMYRSNAGFFRLMEETIESNLNEGDVNMRENGELLELQMGLQLGRSLSELKSLVPLSPNSNVSGEAIEEFASKLF